MICSICSGQVLWQGPMVNLTHTECQHCGAVNSQLPDGCGEDESRCDRCDADAPVRFLDNRGEQDDELICRDCFDEDGCSIRGVTWDQLPEGTTS